jgi:hypothetical protein
MHLPLFVLSPAEKDWSKSGIRREFFDGLNDPVVKRQQVKNPHRKDFQSPSDRRWK